MRRSVTERAPGRTDRRTVLTVRFALMKRIVTAAGSDSENDTFTPRLTAFSLNLEIAGGVVSSRDDPAGAGVVWSGVGAGVAAGGRGVGLGLGVGVGVGVGVADAV